MTQTQWPNRSQFITYEDTRCFGVKPDIPKALSRNAVVVKDAA